MRAFRLVVGLMVIQPSAVAAAEAGPSFRGCPPEGAAIAIATAERVLKLCDVGRTVAEFRVALGRGGVGKRRRGDARTPLGIYSLGEPRPSRRFGTFIPIGYPTPEQAARGYTGSEVGIHGPHRLTAGTWLAVAFDWTQGCIATSSDEELARIVAFVHERKPSVVIF